MSLLEVADLTVHYGDSGTTVVDKLGFTLEKGECLGLVGESGAGKSQTALAIMGLLSPRARVSGSVWLDGVDLIGQPAKVLNRFRATRIATVFQDSRQSLNPYLRIGEQLRYVLTEHGVARGAAAAAEARRLLQRVGLPDADRQGRCYPHQLSGGMRQRAMIALALSCAPDLLIADEPTTALDVTVQAQILDLLQQLRQDDGIGVLLITHDLGVIAENCNRMLVMDRGRLLEQGGTGQVFRTPAQPKTRAMLAAVLRLDEPPPPGVSTDLPTVLQVERLAVAFPGAGRQPKVVAVRDMSFSLRRGETLAIVGESGSGKTTLARAVLGLIPVETGRVILEGGRRVGDLSRRSRPERQAMQLVFQDPVASLDPAMTAEAIVAEALQLRHAQLSRTERRTQAVLALQRVGLDDHYRDRLPHELSGGEAQRLAIARALAFEPAVLFCDEAVAALDATVRTGILDLIQAEQQRTGLAVVFITHDLSVVRRISHRVIVMYGGRLCEMADNPVLFERPRHPYTRALLDAVPRPDPGRRRPATARADNSPDHDAPGCVFQRRCKHAVPLCEGEVPEVTSFREASVACHRVGELDLS